MNTPSKWTDFLNKVPGWLKAAFGLIGAIAAFIVAFRDNWRLYTTVTVVLLLAYVFLINLYILLSRRKGRTKKNQSPYRFGNYRYLGLIGMALACLLFTGLAAAGPTSQIARDGILGTETPTQTTTPLPTPTPVPTQTLVPTPTPPQLAAPDVLIAPFATSDPSISGAETLIESDLRTQLDMFGMQDVTVRVEGSPITQDGEAQQLINQTESKVVIWGWYNELGLQVKLFLSGGEESGMVIPVTGTINLLSEKEPRQALSLILEDLPKDVSFLSLYAIGHLQYLSNNYEAGHQAFDAAMHVLTENAETINVENQAILHFFRARQMDRDGSAAEDVICEYAKAIELDPQFDVAHNNLGLVISRMIMDRTLTSPKTFPCLEQIGLHENLLDLPKLLFERALAANPRLTIANYNRYAFLWLRGADKQTSQEIKLEIENIQRQDPSIIGTYILLAVMKDREGDPAGAIQMYQEGIAVEPDIALLHVNLGQLYLSYEKNEAKAENEFLEALRLDANHEQAHLALGNLYYRQGRLSEASSLLDQILLTDKGDPTVLLVQRDALILRSTISFTEGQPAAAIDDLNRALTKPFGDALLPFLLGLLYQHEGQSDRAAENFNKAAQRDESPIYNQVEWDTFKKQCFTEETYTMTFSDWALIRLPSSNCLPADPRERILAVYAQFNDDLFALREQPSMIFIGAQCPYVYTEDPLTGEWKFDTIILYKVVDREAAQLRPLAQFNGRLLIREQEPEISYLNRLYVLAEMSDGSFQILEPDVEELKRADTDYIVLHQGEEILVSLQGYPLTGEVSQWWVMAVGYYTPLE
jgi:tetratricopeptide (TPR) repeat protein